MEPTTGARATLLGHLTCWILGVGAVLTWNSMLSAMDYYLQVFSLDLACSGLGSFGTYVGVCIGTALFGVAASGVATSCMRLITKASFAEDRAGLRKGAQTEPRLSNTKLLKANLDYVFNIFIIHVVTLAIFPGILAKDSQTHQLRSWYVVTLVTVFNVGDMAGRYFICLNSLKLKNRTMLFWLVLVSEQSALGNILVLALLSGVFVGEVASWMWLI
ncbi:equilibrative nucleotide transporter 3 [Selaginella moellendorffii]|uniref:equilibrative nucleotide transporter 3 n=1 Tax=Selaginella moellendorffii TaxID=88036 RepID=UPI000D1CD920|nr:equilibrative nucleotide transporter 3 [Selaginella moellendorffii]|eukprot:XP_024541103.1 equilibrative nucleotide transporter 3 [Selaginella moellendorffii]